MDLPVKGDASLTGSSRERSDVLSRSLRGNIFCCHSSFEKDIVWNWKFLEKEMRDGDVLLGMSKFVITKM